MIRLENMDKFLNEIRNILPENEICLNEPMSLHTTFKIGGPADIFLAPSTVEECSHILKKIHNYNLPLTIIGKGSNVLVRDKGIRGIVIHLGINMSKISQKGNMIIAQSGAQLKDVSKFASEHNLSGLEFAIGIPGSLGGGIFMNAGAYDGELKNVIYSVKSIDKAGNIKEYNNSEINFGYRHSIFQENKELIVEAHINLITQNKEIIESKMTDLTNRRESKQPLDMASAGSTFKRPTGYFAGTLIDQAGLKGLSVGDAQVSRKHAGFVVNKGNATAQDVIDLIKNVQKLVYEYHGVKIYPEVRIIGE